MTEQQATQAPPAHGTVCWHEVYVREPKKVKPFYAGLFGWEVDAMPMPGGGPDGETREYEMFKRPGAEHIGGLMEVMKNMPQGDRPCWMQYIAVDDIEHSTKKAAELGGTVKLDVMPVGSMGKMSMIEDPGGALFCLWQQLATGDC
jgi:hypothetical protein